MLAKIKPYAERLAIFAGGFLLGVLLYAFIPAVYYGLTGVATIWLVLWGWFTYYRPYRRKKRLSK